MLASTGTAAPRAVDLLDEGASRICRTARPEASSTFILVGMPKSLSSHI